MKLEDWAEYINKEVLVLKQAMLGNGEIVPGIMINGINRVMMMKIFLTLILLCFSLALKAENFDAIYLLTKFKHSEFLKNKSYKTKDDKMVLVPSTLSMTFEVLKELQTEKKFDKKTITLPMDIESDYPFTISGGVVLIVKRTGLNKYDLLDWDFVKSTICVEKQFIPKDYADYYFDVPWMSSKNKRCRFIKTRY